MKGEQTECAVLCGERSLSLVRNGRSDRQYVLQCHNADGTTKKYANVFEFFKRVAVKVAGHTQLSKAAKVFSVSFG